MSAVRLCLVDVDDDSLDLVSSCPLDVAGVFVDTTHVLSDLRFNRSKQKIVDGITELTLNFRGTC